MKKISDRVCKIGASGIRKFFDLAQKEKDIITLGIGEPDFDVPEKIKDRAIRAIENSRNHYTSNYGIIELREKISKKLRNRNKIFAAPEKEILITAGSSEGLDLAFRTIVNPDDEILIPSPSYVSYIPTTLLSDGIPVVVPAYEKDEFRLLPEEIEKRITKRTKCIVLASPNNPTGAILRRKDIEEIADIAIKNDLFVISDELYEYLIYDNEEQFSIASIPEMRERTITVNGFSKSYAMTGLRLGYVAASEEIIEGMMKIHQYGMLCAPSVSQYAALEFENCENDVKAMAEIYELRRNLLYRRLNEIENISAVKPKGAFYIFPNIKQSRLSSENFAERLLKKAKVVVIPGNIFGKDGEGYVRISYSTSTENIEKALERIEKFMGNLRK
ncbi:MAG: aromatic amino acid aminotransferase [Candidatus Altiarchaeales archaeon HGW-Altiarchaeales-2]|nr:MAG: aromatic amino acid aminotransferase [Candidatus Altiarchaeales archaeon HGW-Altiarchaeales-2]